MATPPITIDRPPAQPPAVQSQLSSGLASMLQSKMAGNPQPMGPPTGAPAGGLPPEQKQMLIEAVSRGLQQLARDPQMAPYVERCMSILEAAKGAAGAGQPPPPPQPGAGAGPAPTPPKTPESGQGFPG